MTGAKNTKSEKTVGALVAGLKVLRYMSKVEEPVGVSRVARDLSISPSTCFSLLRTLVSEELLNFNIDCRLLGAWSGVRALKAINDMCMP